MPAAAGAVHDSAPDWFKKIAARKKGGSLSNNKSGGRNNGSGKKQVCKFYAKHGRYYFSDKCKFSHDAGNRDGGNGFKISKGV